MLRVDVLSRLLAVCEKNREFEDRRDAAILRVFIDTGARGLISEVVEIE